MQRGRAWLIHHTHACSCGSDYMRIWAVCVWGRGVGPTGTYFAICARVVEKGPSPGCSSITGSLSCVLTEGGGLWTNAAKVRSGCGLSPRANRTIGTAAKVWPELFGFHTGLAWGLECHSKSMIDGHFGAVSSALRLASCKRWIKSPGDCCKELPLVE